MAAREADVMEDEILETVLWSSSALAISSGTEQLLMLKGFTDPSEVYLLKHEHDLQKLKIYVQYSFYNIVWAAIFVYM